MSTSRYFDRICIAVILCALIVTVLFINGERLGIQLSVDADSEAHSDNVYFTENDRLSDWDTSAATYITLNGDSITVRGNHAYELGGNLIISNSGKYVITGTLDDGYICVDANADSKVWILFNGVDISCSDNACLSVDQADKVFLTLAEGSSNTLSGGSELSEEALEDGSYGVIFAHDDLTINGSGSLDIQAGYRHGIKANDDLVITGGSITIQAPADGIHVNDSFRLMNAALTITAGDDGILTERAESFFYMESGDVAIDAAGDGIHSAGSITIAGGSITMDSEDDGMHADGNVEISAGDIVINNCYEGIEAVIIKISGGDILIYPEDDGLNANGGAGGFGNMMPPGSRQQPGNGSQSGNGDSAAGEGQTEPAGGFEIGGGDPAAGEGQTEPAGGFEIGDGNSAIGEGQSPGMPQDANEGESSGMPQEDVETYIEISGGTLTIINESGFDADGLDSNGSIYISGGDIRISVANNGGNCAIDTGSESGGTAEITGGSVIACGNSGMAEGFGSTSTQCSVLYNLSTAAAAGTSLSLKNENGDELLSWAVPCSFSSVIVSCPEMELGETYTVSVGDQEESVTLSEVSSAIGNVRGGMSGGMSRGGMRSSNEAAPSGEGGEASVENANAAPLEDTDAVPPGNSGSGSSENENESAEDENVDN